MNRIEAAQRCGCQPDEDSERRRDSGGGGKRKRDDERGGLIGKEGDGVDGNTDQHRVQGIRGPLSMCVHGCVCVCVCVCVFKSESLRWGDKRRIRTRMGRI